MDIVRHDRVGTRSLPARSGLALVLATLATAAGAAGPGDLQVEAPDGPAGALARLTSSPLRASDPYAPAAWSVPADRIAFEASDRRAVLWSASRRQPVGEGGVGSGSMPIPAATVSLLAFDPTGKYLARTDRGCEITSAEVFELATGRRVATVPLAGPKAQSNEDDEWKPGEEFRLVLTVCLDPPEVLTLSPGASHLAAAARQGPFTIASLGQPLVTWTVPTAPARPSQAVFAPRGDTLALSDDQGRIRLVDLATRSIKELGRTWTGAGTLAFAPDGSRLYVGGDHGSVSAWLRVTVKGGNWTRKLPGERVLALAPEPDGRTLAVAVEVPSGAGSLGVESLIQRLAADDGRDLTPGFRIPGRVESLEFHEGRLHALVRQGVLLSTRVLPRSPSEADDPEPILGHGRQIEDLAFDPEGRWLVSADAGTVIAWDTRTWTIAGSARAGPGLSRLCVDPRGPSVYAARNAGLVRLGLPGLEVAWSQELPRVADLVLRPGADRALVLTWGAELLDVGLGPEVEVRSLRKLSDTGGRLASDHAGKVVAVREGSQRALVFEGERPTPRAGPAAARWIADLDLSPGGDRLALLHQNDGVLADQWTVAGPKRLGPLARVASLGTPSELRVAWRSRLVAFRAWDRVQLARFGATREFRSVSHGGGSLSALALSRDERLLATGAEDGSILVWDLAALALLGEGPEKETAPARSR